MDLKSTLSTGYFKNGLTFARMGNNPDVLIDIEALNFDHRPPTGFRLKQFISQHQLLAQHYNVYLIGRQPDMPDHYYMEDVARDYALAIQQELVKQFMLWEFPLEVR